MCAMKNITLAIDDELLEKGREYAREHNISLNVLVRRLLRSAVAGKKDGWLDEMFEIADELGASSEGPWSRDELYRV
jgi:hypothetical protein